VPTLLDQRVREGEHDRHVRAGHGSEPLGADEVGEIVAQGAHEHELRAPGPGGAEVLARRVPAGAARAHRDVLERDPAEADEELGVAGDHRPRGRAIQEVAHGPHDVRHDDRERAVAVGVLPRHEAAEAVEEAVELALGVMEAARARPPIGATVHGLASVRGVHPAQLARQPLGCFRPAHGDEWLGAATIVRARAALEPARADHGLGDPRPVLQASRDVGQEWRGIAIVPVRVDGHHRAVLDLGVEGAPVRRVRVAVPRHAVRALTPSPPACG
jgi:hypothetical protein